MMSSRLLRGATAVVATMTMAFGSTAASAATCQAGTAGCLLPLAAPPPVAAPVEAAPVAAEAATGGGIGALAIIAGLAVAGLIAYLIIDGNDDDDPDSP